VTVQEAPELTATVAQDGTFTLNGLPTGTITLLLSRNGKELGSLTIENVARRARASGRSESAVVREAIEAYVGREAPEGPYAALSSLVGIVEDGPGDLSARSGDKVRTLLLTRRAGTK